MVTEKARERNGTHRQGGSGRSWVATYGDNGCSRTAIRSVRDKNEALMLQKNEGTEHTVEAKVKKILVNWLQN